MNKMVIWFDLDGVIFDSYEVWDQVVQGILKHHGVAYTQQIREELWRIPMEDVNAYLLQLVESSLDENEFERQKMNQLQSLYRAVDSFFAFQIHSHLRTSPQVAINTR